jgi:hypothetical protein
MVAYDVCVRVPLEFTLGKNRADERRLASRLLRKLPKPSLVLVDSGFYGVPFLAQIMLAGHEFLTRMRENGKPLFVRWLGPGDGLYQIRASANSIKNDPTCERTLLVRILKVQWKGFRAVRLVSSLVDAERFPAADLMDLYHRRWHIETFFRELAHDVQFEHWHTRRLRVLYVELMFHMIYVSAVRAHMAEAAKEASVLPGDLSFSRGAELCVRAWCQFGKGPPECTGRLHLDLVRHLGHLTIDVRPGRRFERDTQKRRRKSRRKQLHLSRSQHLVA